MTPYPIIVYYNNLLLEVRTAAAQKLSIAHGHKVSSQAEFDEILKQNSDDIQQQLLQNSLRQTPTASS